MENFMVFDVPSQRITIKELLNKEFLELEVWAISDVDPNRRKTHFTLQSIKNAIPTMKNKPILGSFDGSEFGSHDGQMVVDSETNQRYWDTAGGEQVLGVIRESDPIRIETDSDGINWAVIRCILWTNYGFKQAKRLLKDQKRRRVSVEVTIHDAFDREDGVKEIRDFTLNGITILGVKRGKQVLEGIQGAHLSMVDAISKEALEEQTKRLTFAYQQFDADSEANNTQFVQEDSSLCNTNSELGSDRCAGEEKIATAECDVCAERYAEINRIKINRSKNAISDKDWGSVDKDELRRRVVEAPNFKTVAKKIFLDLRDGWEDGEVTKLKYPVMCLDGNTAVYNRQALSVAKAYATKNNEESILKKLDHIFNALGINDDDESDEKLTASYSDLYNYEEDCVSMEETVIEKSVVEEMTDNLTKETYSSEQPETESAEKCACEDTECTEKVDEDSVCEQNEEKCACEQKADYVAEAVCAEIAQEVAETTGVCEEENCAAEEAVCPGCGNKASECTCACESTEEKCECNDEHCNEEFAKVVAEYDALKESYAALESKCNEYEERIEKYSDYEEIKTRMEKAESELFSIHCDSMKNFAISKMSVEKINKEFADSIVSKAESGKYACEDDIINDIAIAAYRSRPVHTDRFSSDLPIVEEKPKAAANKFMTAAERIALRCSKCN